MFEGAFERSTGEADLVRTLLRPAILSHHNFVFGFHQAALVRLSREMAKFDVVRKRPEEWPAFADQNRDACDSDLLDQSGAKEALSGEPSVDIGMLEASGIEATYDFLRGGGHLLYARVGEFREVEFAGAEDDDLFFAIGPFRKLENRFVGLASDDDDVHDSDEFVIAMRFSSVIRQKVEGTVEACEKAVEAGSDEY